MNLKLIHWFTIWSSIAPLPALVLAQPALEASQRIVERWEGIYKETRTSILHRVELGLNSTSTQNYRFRFHPKEIN